ncbi:DUF418 domain-containing protein [Nonomuraea sp. NPDC049784]|uniref:DUF418 domain-containing protein n=1 Tax=Nonomuraea sp. NPDC049784 TaxID=3154361 RepID=UPI0033F8271A
MTATKVTGRSLAPDLARGFMLLPIALAHTPLFVSGRASGALDAVATFLKHLLADNQARPMFVFLFGYALGQMMRRHQARGGDWPSFKALLRRRSLWLIAIGFVNGVVLVPLDIVAVYGVTLLALVPMVRARDSVLWWTAAAAFVPATLMVAWQSMATYAGMVPATLAETMPAGFGAHIMADLQVWPLKTLLSTLAVVPGMLLGVWAARRAILDEPERHAVLLRRIALVCLGAALAGRLPAALLVAGAWTTGSYAAVAVAHTLTGYAGGIGLAALIGLVALRAEHARTPLATEPRHERATVTGRGPLTGNGPHRLPDHAGGAGPLTPAGDGRATTATEAGHGPFTAAVAALGQRSLTFYLLQSVVFVVLFYPFTLDLSAGLGVAAACGIAVALWAVSIPPADWMRRAGHRGPAEVLLRRLTYRRSTTP